MKKIRITCKGNDTIEYTKIKPFQGELKSISSENLDKLKRLILKHGFNSPIHVWKKGRSLFNLDGHQRIIALESFEADGYEIPKIPIDYIKASNEEEAKEVLLSKVSQYGHVEEDGLLDFVKDIDFESLKEDLDIPKGSYDLDNLILNKPKENQLEDPQKNDEDKKTFNLIVSLPTELELRDLMDDLLSKGYIVKEL